MADCVLAPRTVAHVPHLIDLEVLQILRRLERAGLVSADRAAEAINALSELRLVRHGYRTLAGRVWTLRHNLSAYDAVYIALAEALEAPLVTTDARLASAPGHDAEIRFCA